VKAEQTSFPGNGKSITVDAVAVPAHWRPRLVALDIDGTVCRETPEDAIVAHTTVSPAVRAAIAAVLAAEDTHLVLCSGRSMLGVRPFLAEFGLAAGTAICSNGAVWIDAATGELLSHTVFDLTEPVTMLRELVPDAVFIVEELGVGTRMTGRVADLFFGEHRLVDFVELVASPTTRMTMVWPGHTAEELAAVLEGVSLPGVQCSFGHDSAWLFASPAGITKGSALEKLRTQLGVSADETLAVGDGTNDIEMLAWAAHGVAMGQAPPVVRAVADEVCPPVTEDGLAVLLRRWF
jgi:HAD superfamily hydrolase (TIGR01484 family)